MAASVLLFTYIFQYFPVASSTICHLMLSIDRYDTVKRPRVLHLRKKQLIPILVALFALATAGTLSMPFLFVRPTSSTAATTASPLSPVNRTTNLSTITTTTPGPITPVTTQFPPPPALHLPAARFNSTKAHHPKHFRNNRMCTSPENELVPGWYTPFILIHTFCVFILPGLGILMNHVRVRKKLCALSLTARAAHGELPLPMPLLRRPTHVIIVTGMANSNLTRGNVGGSRGRGGQSTKGGGKNAAARGGGGAGAGSSERQVKRKPQSKRLGPHDKRRRQRPRDDDEEPPLDERPMIVSSSQHNNNNNNISLRATASNASNVQQNPEFPLPQTSTLIYRRRLANILMTAAFLFLICWMPYTIAVVYYECRGKRSKIVTDLGLLIGEWGGEGIDNGKVGGDDVLKELLQSFFYYFRIKSN